MSGAAPKPVAKARYGLERVESGMYFHPGTRRYILRTGDWEGPQGGMSDRWEAADWEGGWVVGSEVCFTLRACAELLDRQALEDHKATEEGTDRG